MTGQNAHCFRQIRFLGLFDTVNSVPSFENAWMQRSKFPYTARSSAKVIRHAVSIDERRAKFRQDLISQDKPNKYDRYRRRRRKHALAVHSPDGRDGGEGRSLSPGEPHRGRSPSVPNGRRETLAVPSGRMRDLSEASAVTGSTGGVHSAATSVSNLSLEAIINYQHSDSDDDGEQDIREVWFAGCHAVSDFSESGICVKSGCRVRYQC